MDGGVRAKGQTRGGLATIEREERGDDMIEIVMKITEAGRRELV